MVTFKAENYYNYFWHLQTDFLKKRYLNYWWITQEVIPRKRKTWLRIHISWNLKKSTSIWETYHHHHQCSHLIESCVHAAMVPNRCTMLINISLFLLSRDILIQRVDLQTFENVFASCDFTSQSLKESNQLSYRVNDRGMFQN